MNCMNKKYFFEGREMSYSQVHYLMRKRIPKPLKCPICNEEKKLELTNLDQEYSENIDMWMWKCHSCHIEYDHKQGVILPAWENKKHSEKTKEKMSNSHKGKKLSEEHKKHISEATSKRFQKLEERTKASERTKNQYNVYKSTHPPRACKSCGNLFKPIRKRHFFCSKECRYQYRHNKPKGELLP